MDIYLITIPDVLHQLLKSKGFAITWKRNHMLYAMVDGELFCDFHFDNTLHAIGTGAVYGKKPEKYFSHKLQTDLKKMGIIYRVERVNWFTRRNKAIITGFRV